MSRPSDSHSADLPVAVVHPTGGEARVLVADRDGTRVRVVHAETCPASGAAAVAAAHGAKRIVHVLPASAAITRTASLPEAGDAQLEAAIRLQAETYLLGQVPAHRLGMAALERADGETGRPGLIIGWPERAAVEVPGDEAEGLPVRFTSEVASLAGLLGADRPATPLLAVDPAARSVAVALVHTGGIAFRGVSDDFAPDPRAALARIVAETAITAGHGAAFATRMFEPLAAAASAIDAHGGSVTVLPPEIEAALDGRVAGLPAAGDERTRWIRTYGVALGTALAATGSLRRLCGLEASRELVAPGLLDRTVATLSSRRSAIALGVAAVVLLAVGPAIANGVKLAILKARHPDAAEQRKLVDETRTTLAMLDGLDERAWSMTKILADLTANTPDGVQYDTVRISTRDGSFLITGTASERGGVGGPDLLTRMHADLLDAGPFTSVDPSWKLAGQLGFVEFDFAGSIGRPHYEVEYPVERDFAKWTLADRRSGRPAPADDEAAERVARADDDGPADAATSADDADGDPGGRAAASPPATAVASDGGGAADRVVPARSDAPSSAPSRRPRDPSIGGSAGGAEGGSEDVRTEGRGTDTIPEPLSDAQIATLSETEARERLGEISKARGRVNAEEQPELKARLDREFRALFDHLKTLRDQS